MSDYIYAEANAGRMGARLMRAPSLKGLAQAAFGCFPVKCPCEPDRQGAAAAAATQVRDGRASDTPPKT